jgi:phosphoribosylformimino-5-aminoimidazole carboxamide ribotide isomerase
MTSFEIIPVIDLMGSRVVHARAGERDSYRPLERSVLTASPEPAAVIQGLLDLHPFRALYIADLDAIRKQGDHKALIRDLRLAFPELRFWVDGGFSGECACRRFLAAGLGDLVLGSESQDDLRLLELLRDEPGLVLSLDFMGERALGTPALFASPELWPERVIAMTLARVGVGAGPDLARLRAIRALAPGKRIYAAGGVRGADDLASLCALGCDGVLVASALHDGRLGRAELAMAQGPASGSQS